jgi:hypothetical protein
MGLVRGLRDPRDETKEKLKTIIKRSRGLS